MYYNFEGFSFHKKTLNDECRFQRESIRGKKLSKVLKIFFSAKKFLILFAVRHQINLIFSKRVKKLFEGQRQQRQQQQQQQQQQQHIHGKNKELKN